MKTTFLHSSGRHLLAVLGSSLILAAAALSTAAAQSPPIPQALVQQEVTPAEAGPDSYFGVSVALRRATALIGASVEDSGSGAAYSYTKSGDTWTEGQRITASDPQVNAHFGHRVALQGSVAVVSA